MFVISRYSSRSLNADEPSFTSSSVAPSCWVVSYGGMRPAEDCVVLSPGSPSSLLCGEILSEAFSDSSLAEFAFSLSLLPDPVSSPNDFFGADSSPAT